MEPDSRFRAIDELVLDAHNALDQKIRALGGRPTPSELQLRIFVRRLLEVFPIFAEALAGSFESISKTAQATSEALRALAPARSSAYLDRLDEARHDRHR